MQMYTCGKCGGSGHNARGCHWHGSNSIASHSKTERRLGPYVSETRKVWFPKRNATVDTPVTPATTPFSDQYEGFTPLQARVLEFGIRSSQNSTPLSDSDYCSPCAVVWDTPHSALSSVAEEDEQGGGATTMEEVQATGGRRCRSASPVVIARRRCVRCI